MASARVSTLYIESEASVDDAVNDIFGQLSEGHGVTIARADGLVIYVMRDAAHRLLSPSALSYTLLQEAMRISAQERTRKGRR